MSRRDPKPGRKDANPPCPTAAGGGRIGFVLATATRASAKTKSVKPDCRSVGETELHPPFNVNAVGAANCEVRSSKCEVRPVRQSKFDIRHFLHLWIRLFHSALNEKGRAGFVMANSASDARSSEQELRRQTAGSRSVEVRRTACLRELRVRRHWVLFRRNRPSR